MKLQAKKPIMKMQEDTKLADQIAGHENAGHENDVVRRQPRSSRFPMCQVATVVIETTQLVLSQFKNF